MNFVNVNDGNPLVQGLVGGGHTTAKRIRKILTPGKGEGEEGGGGGMGGLGGKGGGGGGGGGGWGGGGGGGEGGRGES